MECACNDCSLQISDANKPSICGDEFDALKNAFNAIAEDYTNLPTKLKGQGVQRVSFQFSDTDLGSTNLEDSKSLCNFAGRLVSKLKKAGSNHAKRLTAARALVCTEASKVLKLVSNMNNCLRKARKDAIGNDAVQSAAYQAALKFDTNTLHSVRRLLYLMKGKCLMKDTPESEPAPVSGVFRETLATTITRNNGAMTDRDQQLLAKIFNDAVEKKYPSATNIITVFTQNNRRQLAPRRVLNQGLVAVTTWDLDVPAKASSNFDVALGNDYTSSVPDLSAQPTTGSIEVTQPMTPIDADLPDGEDEADEAPQAGDGAQTTGEPDEPVSSAPVVEPGEGVEEATDTGAIEVAVGAVAIVCATGWFF